MFVKLALAVCFQKFRAFVDSFLMQGGQQGGPPPQQQQQQQYGAPSGQYGAPGGQPGGQPGGGYGGPPPQSQPAGPQQVQAYVSSLQQTIQERRLQSFYPPNSPQLNQIAQAASQKVDQLCAAWRIPKEVGNDIVKLALYDIVLFIGMQATLT